MRKKRRSEWIIFIIAFLCIGMIWYFSILKQNKKARFPVTQDTARIVFKDAAPVEKKTEATTEKKKEKSSESSVSGSRDAGYSSSYGKTSSKRPASASTEFDPDDHDIESYYEDYEDDYESIDDAYDGFEDDEDAWDDY